MMDCKTMHRKMEGKERIVGLGIRFPSSAKAQVKRTL